LAINVSNRRNANCSPQNGTVINVIGKVTMDIRIGELILPTRFVVSDNITEPILGVEWLRCNQMTWDFAQDILIIGDKIHHLITGEGGGFCRRVVATEKVTISHGHKP